MLQRLGAHGKMLLVDVKPDEKLALAARNLAGVRLVAEPRVDGARRDGRGARGR